MSLPRIAIVHLGRAKGLGGLRRVAALRDIFAAAGTEVLDLGLLPAHRAGPGDLLRVPIGAMAGSRIVPEALSWSVSSVRAELARLDPDLVVCETSRAYHPALLGGPAPVVLDFVDRLSVSYRDRAGIVGTRHRVALFRALAVTAERFEVRATSERVLRIAAGWADAEALRAEWVPNTVCLPPEPAPGADRDRRVDLVFFGNLAYPPNSEAVDRMASVWPRLQAARPGTSFLLAGANPSAHQRQLATAHGWTVEGDFADLATVLSAARLAVVPLRHASGIQTKVLEAAAHGVPQVVDPVVMAGFAPGFPASVAADDAELVDRVTDLLDDDGARHSLGSRSRAHIAERYTAEAWSGWARALLDRARA